MGNSAVAIPCLGKDESCSQAGRNYFTALLHASDLTFEMNGSIRAGPKMYVAMMHLSVLIVHADKGRNACFSPDKVYGGYGP